MDVIKIRFVKNPGGVDSEYRRALDEMLRLSNPRFTLSRHRWRPQIDIYETAEEIIVRGEIAGVPREGIELEITTGTVKISGIREGGAQGGGVCYYLAEIPCGYFERTLPLPALVDTETAAAVYRDGLLEIRLAKRPLDSTHRIDIHRG